VVIKLRKSVLKWVKLLTFILVFYALYYRCSTIDFDNALDQICLSPFLLIIAFLLVVVNLGLEFIKWNLVVKPIVTISRAKLFQSLLSGISTGMITPNRVGNFIGRVLFFKPRHRAILIMGTIYGNLSQFLATIIPGLIVFLFFGKFIESNTLLLTQNTLFKITVALLIILVGYVKSNRIGIVPMMSVDSDFAQVTIALPYGSPIEKTLKIQKKLIETAQEVTDENGGDQLITGIYAVTGGNFRGSSGGHNSEIRAYLTDADTRPISTVEFTEKWKQKTGTLEGIDAILFESNAGGPGSGASLSIQLEHSNKEELEAASIELANILENYPNVSDIDDGITTGKVQFDFKMLTEGLALGLTSADVATQVRNAFYGSEAIKQQRGRNEITVRVKLPEDEKITESDIYKFQVKTPASTFVPIEDVATIIYGRADSKITHTDGKRTSVVSANVTPKSKSEFILADVIKNTIPKLQEKYPGLSYGFTGRQADLRDGMSALINGFIIALLAIYLLLAIPFKNYAQPLIVMVSIPFGIAGAVIAHIIMGYPLSLMSFMGIVALSGVVVNDSLVLIDFTNTRHRKEGQNHHDAVHDAGIMRFRPIILTTLTTFFGLSPMIFETSRQAKFMVPMAISLGFGIVFATLVTLVLVPCLYLITEDLTKFFKAITGNK